VRGAVAEGEAAMDMTPRAVKTQGVVLVVIDLSKEVSSSAVTWALENAVRNGDLLRLVGIITHVQNPSKSTNLTNFEKHMFPNRRAKSQHQNHQN
jgi:hypothetical protein